MFSVTIFFLFVAFLNSIFWWEVLNLNLPFFPPFMIIDFFLNQTEKTVNHSAVFNSLGAPWTDWSPMDWL